ncbi:hypothetical protein EB796_020052 [Bugula neritina]|uniref:Uncharacterized protein n=1 Tax=Bugula neritina TaxID=10212 RepID=A0A7J7J7B5_BUGNE|nr:hypothetical protein EB796_020052 [Bugula neritina]
MPPKSRRHETPTGASTFDDTDVCSLQQCGNCVCPTRTNRNLRLFLSKFRSMQIGALIDLLSVRPALSTSAPHVVLHIALYVDFLYT